MRHLMLLPLTILLAGLPAFAREPATTQPAVTQPAERPVTGDHVSASDVAATPLDDLNLRKGQMPAALAEAATQTYSLQGLGSCRQLSAAIVRLDGPLGQDFDLPQADGRRIEPGKVAQSVVGSFIPFRDVIREVSGAGNRQRELQSAIATGLARRSFLKGVGEARGCRYPARSATVAVVNQRLAELAADKPAATAEKPNAAKAP